MQYIAVNTYKVEWTQKMNQLEEWIPNTFAGVLAIMTVTAIIGYIVKR